MVSFTQQPEHSLIVARVSALEVADRLTVKLCSAFQVQAAKSRVLLCIIPGLLSPMAGQVGGDIHHVESEPL